MRCSWCVRPGTNPSNSELDSLATEISKVADAAASAESQLLAAGIQDWVYVVKPCKSVRYCFNEAVPEVHHALASDSSTEIRSKMQQISHHLVTASGEIHRV
jgi:hypothetical protein